MGCSPPKSQCLQSQCRFWEWGRMPRPFGDPLPSKPSPGDTAVSVHCPSAAVGGQGREPGQPSPAGPRPPATCAHLSPTPPGPRATCPAPAGAGQHRLHSRQRRTPPKTLATSTHLVFVFGSGCLSTRRVPDGGTWGQSRRREVVSAVPGRRDLGGRGRRRLPYGRPLVPHIRDLLGSLCLESVPGRNKQVTGAAQGDPQTGWGTCH